MMKAETRRGPVALAAAKGWLARSLEGVAYADMKLGNLDSASTTISEASRVDPQSAIVGSTALKVMCLRKADPPAVRAQYEELLGRLDARIARSKVSEAPEPDRQTEARDAAAERAVLVRDPELYLVCSAAGLPRA